VYAAVSSISLSLLATGIDSVFDIGSNLVLFWLHKKAQKLDENKWPVGGSRLETIGNIVYGTCPNSIISATTSHCLLYIRFSVSIIPCFVHLDLNDNSMSSVNLIVIVESVRVIIDKKGDGLVPFHLPSIIAVAAALGKCLGTIQQCYVNTYVYPSCQVYPFWLLFFHP